MLTLTGVACSSSESSTTRDTCSSAIFLEYASGNTVAPQAHNEPDTEPDVVCQDESSAQAPDIVLTAKRTGLPMESVRRAIAFQQAFGKYVDELIVCFPDQISAVWTEPVPNTRGHVQLTGENYRQMSPQTREAESTKSEQRRPHWRGHDLGGV